MHIRLTKHSVLGWLAFYTCLVDVMVLTKAHFGPFSVIVVFPYLVLVPGLLALLALRMKSSGTWPDLFYAVCLSLFLLMLIGLSANWLLPLFGIKDALNTLPLLSVFSSCMAGLLFWASHRASPLDKKITLSLRSLDWSYFAPLVFIVLAVGGAIRLNNGASNIMTIILLLLIALDFFYLYKNCRRLAHSKIIFHIFCIGLSMLLMTSLRGWFITGHDVQREYYVFELAKSHWHWQVALFRDPYNACLSITVLPTMFASFMKISDPYIYKVLFQLLFALCPVAVYILVQRISNRKLAVLSMIYFVAFPTFFMDMPMLNRQEIAFLFFAALLLLLTDQKSRYKLRILLFSLFGAGVVFSHYSTTYALLLIFTMACFIRFLFERRFVERFANWLFKKVHRQTPAFIGKRVRHRLVIIPMIIGLASVAFLWNVQITRTSKGVLDTLQTAMKSIVGNIQKDSRSSDTRVSLFGGKAVDPEALVKDYTTQQEASRKGEDATRLYAASGYDATKITYAPDKPLPLTRIGRWLSSAGINIYTLNFTIRQSFAKILQLLVLIGLSLLFFSKRLKLHLSAEYIAASMSSVFFLTILVFVPVLSIDYGLLRAFQQALIVLALPTAIGTLVLATLFTKKHSIGLTFLIALFFFFTSTGLLAELTGGYLAPLHLHNNGTYYDSYYVHPGEEDAIKWVSAARGNADVQADRIASSRIQTFGKFTADNDIYPGLIKKDTFVYLGDSNIKLGAAFEQYDNEDIQYAYPLLFLDTNKNLLYSNRQSRIYK